MSYFDQLSPIPLSPTAAIYSLAQQKMAAGIRVFDLSAGEPKLPVHPIIANAALNALEKNYTAYPPVAGVPELRNLAAAWMREKYGCAFTPKNCLVTPGGKFGIYLLLQLLLHEKDEVIIPAPYWVSYTAITKIFKGAPKIVETSAENGWKLTPEQLAKACTAKTKILMLNNATNPTGALYSREELRELLKIAKAHHLIVISDEVYSELTYDKNTYTSCGAFSEFQDNVIIIQSCSKNFSMTGWRVGFIFGPEKIIPHLTALNSQSTSGACTVSQWAAVGAFSEADEISGWVNKNMLTRRNVLVSAFKEHFGLVFPAPASTLYLFLSMKLLNIKENDSTEFCRQLLEKTQVALIPGKAFGQEGFIRCSFGENPEMLNDGIKAMAHFL